jgi:hypothetical protein
LKNHLDQKEKDLDFLKMAEFYSDFSLQETEIRKCILDVLETIPQKDIQVIGSQEKKVPHQLLNVTGKSTYRGTNMRGVALNGKKNW